jgi:hypothetical protein
MRGAVFETDDLAVHARARYGFTAVQRPCQS